MTRLVQAVLFLVLMVPALPLAAQQEGPTAWDPARVQLSRADLEGLLAQYEQAAGSDAYSRTFREHARMRAEAIRVRLRDGDLRVGDQLVVYVEGHAALSDTFGVRTGGVIYLPGIGDIRVEGLLRSEVEPHLRQEIGRYVREPRVRALPLLRIVVEGEVGRPGYYLLPADAPVTDVLMVAGGPSRGAVLRKLRIERGGATVWDAGPLQEALAQGRTLDALGLHAGDRFYLPGRGPRAETLLRVVPLAISLVVGVTQLLN